MAKREAAVPARAEQRIGPELKRLRERAGLSLRTLGDEAGFSASFLSQLENGQVSPSIASLEQIAGVLGVTLADLFTPPTEPGPAVVRAEARPSFHSSWSKARVAVLTPLATPHSIEALIVHLEPGGASGRQVDGHAWEQFVLVFDGSVELTLAGESTELRHGDSVWIPPRTPHRWQNRGATPSQILLVSPRSPR